MSRKKHDHGAPAAPAEPLSSHKLVVTYKAKNGKRMSEDFPISEADANDPGARAKHVSDATAHGFNLGHRMVNWTIQPR